MATRSVEALASQAYQRLAQTPYTPEEIRANFRTATGFVEYRDDGQRQNEFRRRDIQTFDDAEIDEAIAIAERWVRGEFTPAELRAR